MTSDNQVQNAPNGHHTTDTQSPSAVEPFLFDTQLGITVDIFNDLQSTRIANENRLRQLTGEKEGQHGLDENDPDIIAISALVSALLDVEEDAAQQLKKVVRRHPLWEWAGPINGVGEQQFARLLAVIGDPYVKTVITKLDPDQELAEDNVSTEHTPRMVSELWSYCGYSVDNGQAPRRKRGVQSNWSTEAKMRVYLIAQKCMQIGRNPYREIYDKRKAATEGRVHRHPCAPCGKTGKPAEPGTQWRDGHRHADALRVSGKEFLKDLWRESKRLHEEKR